VNLLPHGCALRRAGPDDLGSYGELCRRTFTDTYAEGYDAAALARHVAEVFSDDRLSDELSSADDPILAVTHGTAWVAYARLQRSPAPSAVRGARPVEIERFYVERAWHGRGLAGALMDAVLGTVRDAGADVAWLKVWEHNSRALGFYARQGFARIGRATYLFDGRPENDHLLAITL
jgi:GNAT superfamily N-acetyltransferase